MDGSKARIRRCAKMGYSTSTAELRSLLAVAAGLRRLAGDRLAIRSDKRLYLTAAATLEARADRIAFTLPGKSESDDRNADAALHQPVDMLV